MPELNRNSVFYSHILNKGFTYCFLSDVSHSKKYKKTAYVFAFISFQPK